jgi:hypothetical protein
MSAPPQPLDLPALDGTNPLGFLAALGTLAVLSEADPDLRLGWRRGPRWTAFLQGGRPFAADVVVALLVQCLKPTPADDKANEALEASRRDYERALADLKLAKDQPKLPRRAEEHLREERKQNVKSLGKQWSTRLEAHKAALDVSAPSPELRIGKLSQCLPVVFHRLGHLFVGKSSLQQRRVVDLLAAFGIEQPRDSRKKQDSDKVFQRSPFCFTTGSGHQEFIGDIRQLMTRADPTKAEPDPPPCVTDMAVTQALFGPWRYSDPGLSMRWDPIEDTRHALRLDDPSSAGVSTVWMANLLAYRALVFFPCAWDGHALATAGWSHDREHPCFTWPLWEAPLTADIVRSLLRHPAFGEPDLGEWKAELRDRGVSAIYRSRRIQVGSGTNYKVNFTPAQSV